MMRRSRAPTASDLGAVAAVVQRLAVLLAAGVPPPAAWGYLREGAVADRVAQLVDPARAGPAATEHALSVPDAIVVAVDGRPEEEASAWRGLATAWSVATEVGAPLAPTLRDFSRTLRSLTQAQREIRTALAAPAATAKMVLALPAVGLLFGMALGFNTLGTLLTTPVGYGCLVVGGLLLFAASRWNRALVRSARPRDLTPGLEFDLTAIAVTGGGAFDRARSTVAAALASFGVARDAADTQRIDAGVEAVLDLSRRAGVPAAELLRSEAGEERRNSRAAVQAHAASLSVKLMLPLGLCILPAFMVLGVVPLLITVVTSTVVQF